MRYIIYGAGAIGSLFGAYMAKAGYDVILIAREAHANKVNQDGLTIKTTTGNFVSRLPAVTSPANIAFKEDDIVFLTMKSQDTREAVALLSKYAPGDIPVFCCQNGVRNEEIAKKTFNNVYGAVILFSGTYLAPGEVAYTRVGSVGLGVYPQGLNETACLVCETLQSSGFRAFMSESIMGVKWSKLVRNLAMAVNAATGLSGTESTASKESRELIADLTEEGVRVIQAAGIALEDEPGHSLSPDYVSRLRAMTGSVPDQGLPEELKHRPSLWQDLALNRDSTEVDYLNGEIVKLGRKLKMSTPLNSFFVKLIKEMVKKGQTPGTYSIDDLRKLLANQGEQV